MNNNKRLILSLYRINLITCKRLGYKFGNNIDYSRLKKFNNLNLNEIEEDDLEDLVIWSLDNRKIKNKGDFLFDNIKKCFKTNKNLTNEKIINEKIDLGFSINRFISEIIF